VRADAKMRMNTRMSEILKQANIAMPLSESLSSEPLTSPSFTVVDGSVLLRDEYEGAKHVKPGDLQDRTGYECFVNHVHFPLKTRDSLLSCMTYAVAIQRGLAHWAADRQFEVIVSVADDCTVRFHEIRPGESWLAGDLETYTQEAILLLFTDSVK
jgi:hypothetical protein